jgi:hypothetical protein
MTAVRLIIAIIFTLTKELTIDFWSAALSGVGDFEAAKTSRINRARIHIESRATVCRIRWLGAIAADCFYRHWFIEYRARDDPALGKEPVACNFDKQAKNAI